MKLPEDIRVDNPKRKRHIAAYYIDACLRCGMTGLQAVQTNADCPRIVLK